MPIGMTFRNKIVQTQKQAVLMSFAHMGQLKDDFSQIISLIWQLSDSPYIYKYAISNRFIAISAINFDERNLS